MPDAEYRLLGEVCESATSLKRQDRVDLPECRHLCSWREGREPTDDNKRATNRRFYREQSEWWSLPVDKALRLLRDAAAKGLLNDTQEDPGSIVRCDVVSPADANYQERKGLFVVGVPGEENPDQAWQNSIGVICYQKCGQWRKVMLIDKDGKRVTFRSLTNNENYRMAYKKFSSEDGWRLDRAMLDAHVSAFQYWLEYLQDSLPI